MSDSKIVAQKSNNLPLNKPKTPSGYVSVISAKIVNPGGDIQDAYISARKKRGLFARLLGPLMSDYKVINKINAYRFGRTNKQDVQRCIERYDNANKNASEITTDSLASVAAMSAGFIVKKTQTFANIFTPKYKYHAMALTAALSLVTGFVTKLGLKGLDIAGMNKEGRKEQKLSSVLTSGALDGLSGYMSVLHPLFVPAGVAINMFTRYADDKRDEKTPPSVKDFLEKQKDTMLIGTLGIAGVSAAATRGHLNLAKISNSIKAAAVNKEHTIKYRPPADQLTEFQQLARDIGYDLRVIIKGEKVDPTAISKLDEDFMKILLEQGQNGNIDGKIKKLELENIFLPKYLQTVIDIPEVAQERLCRQIDELVESYNSRKGRGFYNGRDYNLNSEEYAIDEAMKAMEKRGMDVNGFKDLQAILRKIRSSCSRSRTLEQAQEFINAEFGNQYTILKPCGVGSVAETYIAKDNKSGDEVVIKIVKDYFLSEDKIAKDKRKILEKIQERSRPDYSWFTSKQTIATPERKEYDIQQAENMFKVWGGEINLVQEAKSASEISSQAVTFNAVDVVNSRKNIFIMKKAEGVPLDSEDFVRRWKEENLTEADFKNWVEYYVRVYCEQLFSIPKTGKKVVQSDPHCGNIFAEPGKIRDIPKGAKALTIIDYGNTTQIEQAEAIKNLFNHIDYLVGNTESIAEAMLEGANLGNQKKSDVIKEMAKALDEAIYNPDTKIDVDNPVKIFSTVNSFCLDFMQKKNIIPNASHINQMKAEETYIISNLGCLKNVADACGYDLSKAIDRNAIINLLVSEMIKATEDAIKLNPRLTQKEITRRYNFFVEHPEEALSCLGINFGIV